MIRQTIHLLYKITTIKQCLKVLEITPPTTKTIIKKQYLSLAKKYHPDSLSVPNSSKGASSATQKIAYEKQKKSMEEKFVEINKAYQHLLDIEENDINANKDQPTSQSSSSSSPTSSNINRRTRTVQQQTRKQTYQYFNRAYRQQYMNMSNSRTFDSSTTNKPYNYYQQHLQQELSQKRRKPLPLYKVVPELFVGFGLLAVVLVQWGYRVYKKKKMIERGEIKEEREEFPDPKFQENIFKRLNHNSVFNEQYQKTRKY